MCVIVIAAATALFIAGVYVCVVIATIILNAIASPVSSPVMTAAWMVIRMCRFCRIGA